MSPRALLWLVGVITACGGGPPSTNAHTVGPNDAEAWDEELGWDTANDRRFALEALGRSTRPPPQAIAAGPPDADFDALLARTRPARPPALSDGVLELPLDWKQLPSCAPRWRRPENHARVAMGQLAILTGFGRVAAVHGSSGRTAWTKSFGWPGRVRVVGSADGYLVIRYGDDLVGISGEDGRRIWDRTLPLAPTDAERPRPAPAHDAGLAVPDPRRPRVVWRIGYEVLTVTSGALVRSDSRSGRVAWSQRLGPELGAALVERSSWAVGDGSLVAVVRGAPALLVVFDLRDGKPRRLQVPPIEPSSVVVAADVAVVSGEPGSVACSLTEEAPSIRELVSLERDVDRSISLLWERPSHVAPDAAPYRYPRHPSEAVEWLSRLRPSISEALVLRMETSSGELAIQLAALLGVRPSTPDGRLAIEQWFASSYTYPPTASAAARLRELVEMLHVIGPADASRLADETSSWLAWLDDEGWLVRMRVGRCSSTSDASEGCRLAWDVLSAVDATYRALGRAASSASAVQRMIADVESIGGAAPLPHDCQPTDAELAQMAALRATLLLSAERPQPVVVEEGRCIAVPTLAGPAPLVFGARAPLQTGLHVHPPWRDPARPDVMFVGTSWDVGSGSCGGELDTHTVRRIDGVWRAIDD